MRIFGFGGRTKPIQSHKNIPVVPYVGRFKVSLTAELSRKGFFIETQQPGETHRECPGFDQTTYNYFRKDLTRIYLESNNFQELQWIAGEMVSHYFWPPSSLGIFYRYRNSKPLKAIEAPLEGVRQIMAGDLALGKKQSAAEHIIKDNKATYIPDTQITDYLHLWQMPDNPIEHIHSREFSGEKRDILKMGWDFSSISKNLSSHSQCMFVMPFKVYKDSIGFFAVGFDGLFWGNFLPMQEIKYLHLLADDLKDSLAKLVLLSKS